MATRSTKTTFVRGAKARCTTYMLWPYMDDAGTQGVWHEFEVKGSGTIGRQTKTNAKIYALREGVERWLITDVNNPGGSARAQSTIAVMWDQAQQVCRQLEDEVPSRAWWRERALHGRPRGVGQVPAQEPHPLHASDVRRWRELVVSA